jgi:hypothetical protein
MRAGRTRRAVMTAGWREAATAGLVTAALLAMPIAASAQDLSSTDRSVVSSLLAVAMTSPAGPIWIPRDSALKASGTRYDVAWGRSRDGGSNGAQETLVLGIRGEGVQRDRGSIGGVAPYAGARLGFRVHDAVRTRGVSAFELNAGVRSYGFRGMPLLPDFGTELAIGWGGYGTKARSSVGLRFPFELVADGKAARLTVFAAPTIAWGTIHTVDCPTADREDDEKNCAFFDKDFALGRPRSIMSGGVSVVVERLALALSAGVQHLSAPGEAGRFWIATSWSP